MSITFNTVPSNAAASAVYVEQEAVSRGTGSAVLDRKIFTLGQYNTGFSPTVNTPQLILSKSDAWTRYGRGSMLARMLELQLNESGGVPVYAVPLADGGAAVAATGTIVIVGTATAAGTLAVYVEGEEISVAVASGDTPTVIGDSIVSAINADLDLPVTAANVTGTVTFTVRWKGESGNQINLAVNLADADTTPAGITSVTVTDIGDVVAGATDPVLTTAFANMGDVWYTDVTCPYTSAASLTAMEAAGVVRDGPAINKMFAGFVGYTDTIANFLTALSSRNSEWTSYFPVPGSPTAAYMLAAGGTASFARYQQATPGRPQKNLKIPGAIAGNEDMGAVADTIVSAGGSWTQNNSDGTVTLKDLCTTRTTEDGGAETEDWRFTVIIPNIQFKRNSIEQAFLTDPYDRAVVAPDNGGKGPTYVVRPKTVKTRAIGLVDDWIERGLSTSRADIVDNMIAEIDSANPGRINLLIPDIATAGLRIVAVKLEWAFTA
jgi:phage tail sheath gpL-like